MVRSAENAGELWARVVSVGDGGNKEQRKGVKALARRTTRPALIALGTAHWPARCLWTTMHHARNARRDGRGGRGRWEESGTHLAGEAGVDELLALGMPVGVDACEIDRGGERAGADGGVVFCEAVSGAGVGGGDNEDGCKGGEDQSQGETHGRAKLSRGASRGGTKRVGSGLLRAHSLADAERMIGNRSSVRGLTITNGGRRETPA
ncbi:hypothetical protein FRC12_014630 [Ceratobasidium sp. 428]|nr:hypothetical protein FRC12_014630 [Ceratobasidium sp. 428]